MLSTLKRSADSAPEESRPPSGKRFRGAGKHRFRGSPPPNNVEPHVLVWMQHHLLKEGGGIPSDCLGFWRFHDFPLDFTQEDLDALDYDPVWVPSKVASVERKFTTFCSEVSVVDISSKSRLFVDISEYITQTDPGNRKLHGLRELRMEMSFGVPQTIKTPDFPRFVPLTLADRQRDARRLWTSCMTTILDVVEVFSLDDGVTLTPNEKQNRIRPNGLAVLRHRYASGRTGRLLFNSASYGVDLFLKLETDPRTGRLRLTTSEDRQIFAEDRARFSETTNADIDLILEAYAKLDRIPPVLRLVSRAFNPHLELRSTLSRQARERLFH